MSDAEPLTVAFPVFDGLTTLDLVGAHDPITRLDGTDDWDLEWDICARRDAVTGGRGLTITADRVDPDLGEYDLVVVPGGRGTRDLRTDEEFLRWLRAAERCDLVASVCTGSLLLGAAGFLDGRRATTHPGAYDLLAEYCEVVEDRVVDAGDVVTGAGVSASIDLGLRVVERLAGTDVRDGVAAAMDYPYGPPGD